MRRSKFAAALMIVTAGSALIGAGTAIAEEVKAHGHMPPPPLEWRGPGGHMPPPPRDWNRGPRPGMRMPAGPRGPMNPGRPEGPGGHMPPPGDWGRPGGPGGHMPPPPRW